MDAVDPLILHYAGNVRQCVYLYISYVFAMTIGTITDLAGFAAIRIMLVAYERRYGKTL